jgi:hypothetical protein
VGFSIERSCFVALLALAAAVTSPGASRAGNEVPSEAQRAFEASSSRTAAVSAYVARLNADIAMKSFPYLKFHLTGTISYKRPNLYSVHFDHVPWFAKGFDNIAMDELEPSTWPSKYDVISFTQKDGVADVELRDRLHASLDKVFAQIDGDGLRSMRWLYTGGDHIEWAVVRTPVDGIPLPSLEEAQIHRPIFSLDAHATISEYKLTVDPPGIHGTH